MIRWVKLVSAVAVLLVIVYAAYHYVRSRVLTSEAPPPETAHVRDGSPAWSPDSSRIAFYSERDGNAEIYVMQADGSRQTRLTHHPADEGYPSWSPDGRTISFDSDRDGDFEIYAMDADGSNVRRLTRHPARDVSASWSPDGTRIAFMSDRNGDFDVYVMQADGSKPTRVTTQGTNWFPLWSPDGGRLAIHVERDVHTLRADGSDLKRLTTDPDNGMYPSWSPDGRRIAFMSWRRGASEVFVMNADGSNQQPLIWFDEGDAIDPRWSPDGSKIVFCHLPGGMDNPDQYIYVANADGTGLRQLTGRPGQPTRR
jgi:Tol biopolymer transport system component